MRWRTAGAALALIYTAVLGGPTSAGEPRAGTVPEVRDFQVRVDGQTAGSCRLTTVHYGAHRLSMTAAYRMQVQGGPAILYRYTNQDRETWKDGRLERFESRGQEDGRLFAVRGEGHQGRFHIRASGRGGLLAVGLGTTACWQLPMGCPEDGVLPLIDDVTGQQVGIHFRFLGTDRITVGQRTNECRHFELAGPRLREAWYDGLGRLVRQEEDIHGQHLVIELIRVH